VTDVDVDRIIDTYEALRERRLPGILEFLAGRRPYLIHLTAPCEIYANCNSIRECFENGLADLAAALEVCCDCLPFLEPWFGTGAYAEAFGCEYLWREGESPACHYAWHKIEELRDVRKPDPSEGSILRMVLEAIEYFKERTKGRLPICLTDTQSPHDTATLILDAVEVFTAGYTEPETLGRFLQAITDLIIEFSRQQARALGDCLVLPGHIISSSVRQGSGISVSDDNLAVVSPAVAEQFLLS